jgi:hypothetical protein
MKGSKYNWAIAGNGVLCLETAVVLSIGSYYGILREMRQGGGQWKERYILPNGTDFACFEADEGGYAGYFIQGKAPGATVANYPAMC